MLKIKKVIVKENSRRKGCKDVFKSFLVSNGNYDGIYDIPIIHSFDYTPSKLIRFSKCLSNCNYECWIHFYEDDHLFERVWNNPKKYLNIFKKYEGVILPDFSLYRDMPFAMQIWNIYRSRAIGNWLQNNGVKVIPNLRFGDERTYDICCSGIDKNSTISIGTHGTYKNIIDRKYIIEGTNYIIDKIKPNRIIIYGQVPFEIEDHCISKNIELINFPSEYIMEAL